MAQGEGSVERGRWSAAVPGWASLAGEDAGPPGRCEEAAQPGQQAQPGQRERWARPGRREAGLTG
jgi:hypothetical protein